MSRLLGSVVKQAHELIEKVVERGDQVVDGTAGNGYDTLFLARLVAPKGKVIVFDIQEEALERTKQRLKDENFLDLADFHLMGHEKIEEVVKGPLKAVMFNLGYLPKGDHRVITQAPTTIKAIEGSLKLLVPQGLLTVILYPGHPGGQEEAEAVLEFLQSLDPSQYAVLRMDFINRINKGPFLVAIEKQK